MFTHRVIPYLKSLADGVIVSRTLKLFGIGESSMEAQLREEMEAMTNPTLAPYAKEGECELRITAKAADEEAARALIAPVEERLRARFGPLIYGADVPSLEAAVFQLLKEKGLTLGCAESCTGGLIAKRMTDLSGVSAVFRGGVVSYATEVKHTVLGVDQALLDEFGAVSEPVARAMAEGAGGYWGAIWRWPPPAWPGPIPTSGATRWDWSTWPWPRRTAPGCGKSSRVWAGSGYATCPPPTALTWPGGISPAWR